MSKIDEMIAELCPDGVEYKRLGDIGTFTRGAGIQKKDFVESGLPCVHYGQIYTRFGLHTDHALSYITESQYAKCKKANPGDIIFAITSENIDDVCTPLAWEGNEPVAISGHSCAFSSEQINARFLAYLATGAEFQKAKLRVAKGTKVIEVSPLDFARVEIPIPPIEIQKEIVRILDKFAEYAEKLAHLREEFSFDVLDEPMGETEEREFIQTFSAILRLRNILSSFDAFEDDDTMGAWELQGYQGMYLDLRDEYRRRERAEKESIADDLVFEMELVRQTEINIDYILMLVERRHGDNMRDREIAERIRSSVAASPELRDKQDLIDRFLEMAGFGEVPAAFAIDPEASEERRHEIVSAHWRELVRDTMEAELGGIIESERLKPEETRALVGEAFEAGGVPQEGTAVARILPPVSRFAKGNPQVEKRHRVTELLSAFHNRFRSFTAHYPMRVDN